MPPPLAASGCLRCILAPTVRERFDLELDVQFPLVFQQKKSIGARICNFKYVSVGTNFRPLFLSLQSTLSTEVSEAEQAKILENAKNTVQVQAFHMQRALVRSVSVCVICRRLGQCVHLTDILPILELLLLDYIYPVQ